MATAKKPAPAAAKDVSGKTPGKAAKPAAAAKAPAAKPAKTK